jgi:hypothetical protein
MKENKTIEEAMKVYGSQIMSVVENYKKYVANEI